MKRKTGIWEDVSSYSQGEARGTEPKSVQARLCPGLRLDVHHYLHCGDAWFVSCGRLLEAHQLKATTLDAAKSEAVGLVRALLTSALTVLGKESR